MKKPTHKLLKIGFTHEMFEYLSNAATAFKMTPEEFVKGLFLDAFQALTKDVEATKEPQCQDSTSQVS